MKDDSVTLVSACGIFDCKTCVHRTRERCIGCEQGNALMAAQAERQCAVFECARYHKITSCKECAEPTCPFTKSPEMACPVRARFEKRRSYGRTISDYYASRQPLGQDVSLVYKKLDKAIARLPWYLFAVQEFISHGVERVSSEEIARKVGVKPWLIRRDLSQFGEFGRPSLGYETALLKKRLSEILHLTVPKNIVWVGAARLDADKSLIERFARQNYQIVAVFDRDLSRAPEMIGGLRVRSIAEIPTMIAELDAEGAIIATPTDDAQLVADVLITSGIKGLLNLTSTLITAPVDVCVRNVDVVAELFALSYYCAVAHGHPDSPEPVDK